LAGVEKGRKAGTQPVEVMGLMIGKPDGDSIIVLDACPLPVEGSETRVVADDAQVYMTKLMDSMELVSCDGVLTLGGRRSGGTWSLSFGFPPFNLQLTVSPCFLLVSPPSAASSGRIRGLVSFTSV
jgi:hypothetical protein